MENDNNNIIDLAIKKLRDILNNDLNPSIQLEAIKYVLTEEN